MEDFKDLRVWEKAHELTLGVYKATRSFPKEEMYGLTSQLRASASSVGANIAEGCGRRSDPEMATLSANRSWARQMKLNTICCWRGICSSYRSDDFKDLEGRSVRNSAHARVVRTARVG